MRKGILAAGNWIIDQEKVVDRFPGEETLANILEEYSSNGGSAYNVLKDLSKMKAPFPLEAAGLVGEDGRGLEIIEECRRLSVKTSQLRQTSLSGTSYTDVISARSSGKRTFFHHRGANALLDETHFDFEGCTSKIFHLGYLLLLDKLDMIGEDGVSGAARVLERAHLHGLQTSVDLVSEDSQRFRSVIPPSLPFIDYLFVNEFEAGMLAGMELLNGEGCLEMEKCAAAAKKIIRMGVRKWVFLHFPAGVLAIDRSGEQLFQPGLDLPAELIRGTVGAGDAFAAGVLLGIHEEQPMHENLRLGVCAAASSLLAIGSSDGVLPVNECLALADTYDYVDFQALIKPEV